MKVTRTVVCKTINGGEQVKVTRTVVCVGSQCLALSSPVSGVSRARLTTRMRDVKWKRSNYGSR